MKFGVVTPSMNQGRYVAQTVGSVLCQVGDDVSVEYVFMDGGSKDDTLAQVQDHLEKFSYWQSKEDSGQAHALAVGFTYLDADVFSYINSDDFYLKGAFVKARHIFEENPEVDFIYSNRIYIDENQRVIGCWKLPRHSDWLMSRWDFIPQETLFWRKEIFEKVGPIDQSLNFCMDYDFLLRLMKEGRGMRVDDYFGVFRLHGDSKTMRLYKTVGLSEIEKVQIKYGIKANVVMGKLLAFYIKFWSKIEWIRTKHKFETLVAAAVVPQKAGNC
jgi:glycosyltransferase involved in cell wall biosynthesis